MTTCPHCGHSFQTERDKAERARKAAFEATRAPRDDPARVEYQRAYQRDYKRGLSHARKGKPQEAEPSEAYLAGFARGAEVRE